MTLPSLLLMGLLFASISSNAQTANIRNRASQVEIMELTKPHGNVTNIELRDNGLFVDGTQVATREELSNQNLRKRIVLRHGMRQSMPLGINRHYDGNRKNRVGNRALLGVDTAPTGDNNDAYVERVSLGGPAANAGLQEGDIIPDSAIGGGFPVID